MTRDQELDAAGAYGRRLAAATAAFAVEGHRRAAETVEAMNNCRKHHDDVAHGRPSSLFVPPLPPSVCPFIEG